MIKAISVYDLLSLRLFKEMTAFDIIKLECDKDVHDVLYVLGFDVGHESGVSIQACKHRRLDGTPVVGYRYVARERVDKAWWPKASLDARINSHPDMSLRSELYAMSREGVLEENLRGEDKAITQFEPDMKNVRETIKALQDVQMNIRGYLTDDENVLF